MQRRNFLKQGFAAGAASLVSSSLLAAENNFERKPADNKPFKLNYGFHDGMFKNY
jgi:hydroxypyruvate isomerase